jgi:hypothetical protein
LKPLFTIHAGEYLVGDYIERHYPKWNVWIPSQDTGIDILLTNSGNTKAVSLQVKFSKDFAPTHHSPLEQSHLLSTGWWTHDPLKIRKSPADFWVFVLPSFLEKQTSFIILPPAELLHRFRTVFPGAPKNRIHSYFRVTRSNRCWEARGLSKTDQELLALDRLSDDNRELTRFLNAWKQIEARLK